MSKIMQQLYAEARAAREASASAIRRSTSSTEPGAPNPSSSLQSSIEWWKVQYDQAGRAAAGESATAHEHLVSRHE